jgi:hypothetical protein
MKNTTLAPDWAELIARSANEAIKQNWHPATALRSVNGYQHTFVYSTQAIIGAWCPSKRGYIFKNLRLVNNEWLV